MPVASQNGVPSSFTQGDTVVFTYSDPNYPPSAWGLKLALLKDGTPFGPFAGTPDADGVSFDFALTTTQTAALPPGRYVARLVATATDNSARLSLCQTGLFVFPDLTVPLAPTPAMETLAALRAGYTGLSTGTIQTYSGGGQSWSKKNLGELQKAIDRWQVTVDSELRDLGLSTKGGAKTLLARFC